MKRQVYYRIEMQLASPLSVGSGRNETTDHDIVRDKSGKPYIPASSIAGVFRHTLDDDISLQNSIFGMTTGNDSVSSKVIFYDGNLVSESIESVRDGVKLDKKVGVDGSKFDMETIETGAVFSTIIEIADADTIDSVVEKMISKLRAGVLRLGTKTSRGYGVVRISSLKKCVFESNQLDDWLDFDPLNDLSWNGVDEYELSDDLTGYWKISLHLMQKGAISIREYSTDVSVTGETLPDFKHISLHDKYEMSVIPGTSWAGAFRARFLDFAGQTATDALFGYVNEKNKTDSSNKSRIIFSESVISDNLLKTMTRNSIDRFSAATKETALYTERTSYNGHTDLTIYLADDATEKERAALGAVILDMHHGFLSVGGLTSVGRGMFHVMDLSVNGVDKSFMLDSENAVQLLEV